MGVARLVSISLISPMKNILLVLRALQQVNTKVIYHIYGPVKDPSYWEACKGLIQQMPSNVTVEYKGEVLPHNIHTTLKDYHYFVLPSKSENFGHAIYEALSSGRPVITSHNTPWNGLEAAYAGYNVNPEDITTFADLIDTLAEENSNDYSKATLAARKYIEQRYNIDDIKAQYREMFLA